MVCGVGGRGGRLVPVARILGGSVSEIDCGASGVGSRSGWEGSAPTDGRRPRGGVFGRRLLPGR